MCSGLHTDLCICEYSPDLLPSVYRLYLESVAGLPHCHDIGLTAFGNRLWSDTEWGQRHSPPIRDQGLLLARKGKEPVALAHWVVRRDAEDTREPSSDPEATVGGIRHFWYQPGHRATGQALLETAETRVARHTTGPCTIRAMDYADTYSFYHVEHAYMSDRQGHVHALLEANGYRRVGSEVVLDCQDMSNALPEVGQHDVEVTNAWAPGAALRPGLTVRVAAGGRDAAVCVCRSLAETVPADEAQDWVYVRWLGVDDAFQGRGLGRYTLLSALCLAREAGYRHATICAYGDNYRALLLYSNINFSVVDWTYLLQKQVDAPAGDH